METNVTLDQAKYSKDGAFNDPVVRCDSCQMLLFREQIRKLGMCECGNRRIRNVMTLKSDEMALLKEKGVDPDFLALFEGVDSDR